MIPTTFEFKEAIDFASGFINIVSIFACCVFQSLLKICDVCYELEDFVFLLPYLIHYFTTIEMPPIDTLDMYAQLIYYYLSVS